jgi:recombination protein RecA
VQEVTTPVQETVKPIDLNQVEIPKVESTKTDTTKASDTDDAAVSAAPKIAKGPLDSRQAQRLSKELRGLSAEDVFNALSDRFSQGHVLTKLDTGSPVLNRIWGGGLPQGRFVELRSPSAAGKSTATLSLIKSLSKQGHKTLLIDAEHAINESLLQGVGLADEIGKHLLLHKARTYDEAETLIQSYCNEDRGVRLIVIDSMTALIPTTLAEERVEAVRPGLISRTMATFLQKYKGYAETQKVAFLFINQMRVKMEADGRSWSTYEDSAVGKAFEFYMDIRTDFHVQDYILDPAGDPKSMESRIGTDIVAHTFKNKVTKPFVTGVLSVLFGKGVSNSRSYLIYLTALGAMKQGGSSYNVDLGNGITFKCRGWDRMNEWLLDNDHHCSKYLIENGFYD